MVDMCSLYANYMVFNVIAGVYIPSPFSAEVLKILASFMAHYPTTPLIAVGDYNNLLDLHWEKLSSDSQIHSNTGNLLHVLT